MALLILTASYGSGHNAAAKALMKTAHEAWVETKVLDLVDLFKHWGKLGQSFYDSVSTQHPYLRSKTFDLFDNELVVTLLYAIKNPLVQREFDAFLEEFEPEHIIVVFPFWHQLVSHSSYVRTNKPKIWVVITDAMNVHYTWYDKKGPISNYFVIDDHTKSLVCEKFSWVKQSVITSFFPLSQELFFDRSSITIKRILFLLTGIEQSFAEGLLDCLSEYEITVVQWRNTQLFKKLKKKFLGRSHLVFAEFLPIFQELPQFDLVVAKPGGALMSECIATDTPLIVPSYIPGQEKGNVELIEMNGLGIYESDPAKIAFHCKYCDFSRMIPAFHAVKKKESCEIVLATLDVV